MTDLPHDKFPPQYQLLKKIGRGGTSDLYLANAANAAKPVVLKSFYAETGDELAQRELECAARLNFPGIVKVFGDGQTDRRFLVLEHCPGQTAECFAGQLLEAEFLSALSAITISLQVVHLNGIVHNDLKPSNIFCPPDFGTKGFDYDSKYYLKLIDFSLADLDNKEGRLQPTGTVGYMSPEMIAHKKSGPASDLFSLGVTAYFLASGKLPFVSQTNDPLEINNLILEGDRPDLTGNGANYSPKTAKLINSLLAIDPKDRPESAFALLEMLARLGSPYPFRTAIRPRHLLPVKGAIDEQKLAALFGNDCFSTAQLRHLKQTTSFDRAILRFLFEHNYDVGNFARLDGRWGWKSPHPECIAWDKWTSRFALRPLRNQPFSLVKLAMAQAVLGQPGLQEKAAEVLKQEKDNGLAAWNNLPPQRTAALIYSLDQSISIRTRKILSTALADSFTDHFGYAGLAGKLLFQAGRYLEAVKFLLIAIDKMGGDENDDQIKSYFQLAEQAAQKSGQIKATSDVFLRKGAYLKETGQTEPSEAAYYHVIDLYDHEEDRQVVATAYKGLSDLYKSTSDYKSGINALNRAMSICKELGDQLGVSNCLNNQGNMYWVAGKFDQALEKYQEALEIQRQLQSEKHIASTLNNIGSFYVVKGRYEESLEYFKESLQIKEKLGDKGEIARSWNNLGVSYFYMGQSDKAVAAYEQSMALNLEIGSRIEQLFNIDNLAEVMVQSGRLGEALKYVRDGSQLAENIGDDRHGSTFARITERLQRRMGYYVEAEKSLDQALKLARQSGNRALEVPCLIDRARLHLALREYNKIAQPLEQATEIARDTGDNNALFHLALLRYEVDHNDQHLTEAGKFLEKLQTDRESALLQMIQLEKNNREEKTNNSEALIASASAYFSDSRHDIDMARFRIACGHFYRLHEQGVGDKALETLTAALDQAKTQNLQPEMWRAADLLSSILFTAGDFEKSYEFARTAADTLKNIAGRIDNIERLQRLYNDRQIIELLGRIKSLKSVLTK